MRCSPRVLHFSVKGSAAEKIGEFRHQLHWRIAAGQQLRERWLQINHAIGLRVRAGTRVIYQANAIPNCKLHQTFSTVDTKRRSSRRMHGIFGERERAHNDCICTSHPSLFTTCTLEPRRLERPTASARHRRVQRMPLNGTRVLSLARYGAHRGSS